MRQEDSHNKISIVVEDKPEDRLFFSLMQRAGSKGRYQTFTFCLWSVVSYLIGGIVFIVPFLYFQNSYVCEQYSASQCYDFVCSLGAAERSKYIVAGSFESLINKLGDYRCHSQTQELNWVITASFSGVFFGMLFLVLFGDCFGRKTLTIVNLLVAIVGMILTLLSSNLVQAGIGMFLANLGVMASFNINFYFIAETVSEQYRDQYSAQVQVFYGVGATSNVLWFYSIGDYQHIMLFCYVAPSVIVFFLILIYVKETPMYLVNRHKTEKALKDFKAIAKFNKKNDFEMSQSDLIKVKMSYQKSLNLEKKDQKNFTFLDLFKFKSLRFLTIVLTVLICSITFIFIAPTLLIDKFHFDIFISCLIIESSQILASILACFIIRKIKRKTVAFVCFTISLLSSFFLVFLWDQFEESIQSISQKILIIICVFFIQLSISIQYANFYVYFNQIYPTQARVLGTGFVATFSGLLFAFSQKLIEVCQNHNVKVMIIFTILAIVCLICTFVLPQTFGKIPAELIAEFAQKGKFNRQSLLSNQITYVQQRND